jgi:hypothetical protein
MVSDFEKYQLPLLLFNFEEHPLSQSRPALKKIRA